MWFALVKCRQHYFRLKIVAEKLPAFSQNGGQTTPMTKQASSKINPGGHTHPSWLSIPVKINTAIKKSNCSPQTQVRLPVLYPLKSHMNRGHLTAGFLSGNFTLHWKSHIFQIFPHIRFIYFPVSHLLPLCSNFTPSTRSFQSWLILDTQVFQQQMCKDFDTKIRYDSMQMWYMCSGLSGLLSSVMWIKEAVVRLHHSNRCNKSSQALVHLGIWLLFHTLAGLDVFTTPLLYKRNLLSTSIILCYTFTLLVHQ